MRAGLCSKRLLQSKSKGSIMIFSTSLFISKTMLNASSSMMRLSTPISLAIFNPSLNAHSSAIKLLVCLIPLTYPFTQLPSWSRNKPPPPALLGLFIAKPLEFNFSQPRNGFSHPTGMIVLAGLLLASSPIAKNSVLYLRHFFQHWLSTILVLKTKLFVCNHSC